MKIYSVTEWYDPEKEFIDSAEPPIAMVKYEDVKPLLEECREIFKDAQNYCRIVDEQGDSGAYTMGRFDTYSWIQNRLIEALKRLE